MKFDSGIPAIPLWINGHAYFNVFEAFIDIRDADGSVNFRVPRCGAEEAALAVASAGAAQPVWRESAAERERLLAALADLLDQFGGDFAKLVMRETGKTVESARDEVARAVATLRSAPCAAGGGGVRAVFSDAENPLASAVAGVAEAWAAGDAVVVLSDPRAPSAVFAFAELSARAECPAGALCLLHGDAGTRASLTQAVEAQIRA